MVMAGVTAIGEGDGKGNLDGGVEIGGASIVVLLSSISTLPACPCGDADGDGEADERKTCIVTLVVFVICIVVVMVVIDIPLLPDDTVLASSTVVEALWRDSSLTIGNAPLNVRMLR